MGDPAAARPYFIDVKLVAETLSPKQGQSILIGFKMVPQPGWHGYWSNPGESGLAPVVKWDAPRAVRFGPLQHPAPTLLNVMGLTSYVHAGPHMLLARMTVDGNLATGTALPITANVSWAACSNKLCVSEKARLSLKLRVGNGSPSLDAPILRRAVALEPKAVAGGSFEISGRRLVLRLSRSVHVDASRVHFFPDENGYWDPIGARAVSGSPLVIESPTYGLPLKKVTGVVSDGSAAYRVSLKR